VWANPVVDPGAPGGITLFNVTNNNTFGQFDNYEGIAINGNTLYLSVGDPTALTQTIWAMPLVRNNGHISSAGTATPFLTVSNDGAFGDTLGGGLLTVNGSLLYTILPSLLGQSGAALTDLQTSGEIGGLQVIPAGQGNAGQLKVSTTSGDWYTVNVSGSPGSYTVNSVTRNSVGVLAYSFAYLPADATFGYPGIILGDANYISLYYLDGNGNPCVTSGCGSVIHLVDAGVTSTVGFGIVRDPVTGDVLFTTGDNQIFRLSDTYEVPEPSTLLLASAALALLWIANRRGLLHRNRRRAAA
jgi:hypothetical protein